MKNATRIVSVSSYTMNVLVEQFPSIARKISLLPCSVDGEKFYHQVKSKKIIRLHSLNGQKIIFTLARLTSNDQYKGYEHVLNIMPSLIEQVPNALYIIGGEGDYVPKLKSIIKRLKLEQHVVLTGFIPESNLIEYYNLADVFVMPSKQEGFGIVFLEALACGTPVITGARDGSQDAVLQGKVGLMVDPNNQEDLLKAVVSILNRSAPERLIDPNYIRKTTLEHYGFDVFKDNFVELIRSTTR